MKKALTKKVISLCISLQMAVSIIPCSIQSTAAAKLMYLQEDCTAVTKWTGTTSNLTVKDDEQTSYIRYTSSSDTEQVTSTRKLDTSLSDGDVYIAELDIRFSDDNSGVVELYGGSKLGPTIIFDGSEIKTKIGNPSSYATMYKGASAGVWYNIKFLTKGTSSMVAYTVAADSDDTIQATTSEKVIRNLTDKMLTQFNVTNKINNESTIRTGAVDIRNMKVYKPEPTDVKIGVTDNIARVSIPESGTNKTVNYTVESIYYSDVDLSGYDPLANELVKFELYDADNENSLADNMPTGISLSSVSGVLTISSSAEEGEYNVRLMSYDGAAYDSAKIEVVNAGEVQSIELIEPAEELPIPNSGTVSTAFSAQCYDEDGMEAYGIPLKWSLLDENGDAIDDEGISIDADTGTVYTTSSATAAGIKIKVEAAENPDIYTVSDTIPTYKMQAAYIELSGADYIQTNIESSAEYSAAVYDTHGIQMPAEKVSSLTAENLIDGITFENGVLTAETGTQADIIIKAQAGDVMGTKTVKVYSPVLTKIIVDGDRSAEIPSSGTSGFTYSAAGYDQNNIEISGLSFEWNLSEHDSTDIAFDSAAAKLTVGSGAAEQTVTISAKYGEVSGDLNVVVTENPFTYKPVYGGFEIDNGSKNYTRPIYAAHTNDAGKTSFRYIYYLGDTPKLVLSNAGTGTSFYRFAHMFLGIKDGKWLDEMSDITARYVNGHEEYVIKDESFEGEIKLTYTRSDKIDAMMIKVELPDDIKDKLVTATAGGNRITAGQPTGGNSTKLEFDVSDTTSTVADISGNAFSLTGDYVTISGTSNVEMNYEAKDAAMYNVGLSELLESSASIQPMVVGTTEGNTENTIYMLITTEDPSENENFAEYQTNPADIFDASIEYYESVSQTIKVDTPDPYINSAITAQVMAMDNLWDDPVITHGAIGWHNGQGGWRGGYGFVYAGWGDRLKTNIQSYIAKQETDTGRIWAYPDKDGRYNMSLVMVDIMLEYWRWSGDDDFFANDGGYDFVAGHLQFMDDYMQVPETNLYENWLDAWNTDNKWNNGGAGSIATAYTWRAYDTMSEIAEHLGKDEDSAVYREKADAIKSDMNEQLWDTDTGVFGELRERFGYGRLNAAPDLSSVYTVIDMGLATEEQAYQMMRYTDYAIPSVSGLDKIWDNIDFKYSSNRLPLYYSSDGLYVEEVMNNALANFESGNKEMGMEQFRACLVPLMKGSAAGQGTVQHIVKSDLTNNGHIDFGDCTSQYARTAVEGIFGIKLDVPNGTANITPGFPDDWQYASIETEALSYEFNYSDNTDSFSIKSAEELEYSLHIPARSSKIESVTINGTPVTDYTVDNYVNITAPKAASAEIKVTYADEEPASVTSETIGGAKSEYTVKTNGVITGISDPQEIITDSTGIGSDTLTVTLSDKTGNHTFFVDVVKDDMTVSLPVDVEIREDVEITDMNIVSGSEAGIEVSLTNNTEKALSLSAELSTVSGSVCAENIIIQPKSASDTIFVPVSDETDLTPGDNKVTAVLTGDIDDTVTGVTTNWELADEVEYSSEQYKMISLDDVVNQDLRTLHENEYDMTYDGDEHYRLERFYWSSDTERTVLANGRSWWEPDRGASAVPDSLTLTSGEYVTDIGIPFLISSQDGNNAAFVSLYNQFPDKITIPVNTDASKLYFMLSVSTNNMQSRIENARITVHMKDGTQEILSLTNPDNIDDWLSYQQSSPYAESGYIQMLGDKAHSNILTLDLGKVCQIDSIDFECLSCEVLAGLLGITAVTGEYTQELEISEITFDKESLTVGETICASAVLTNNGTTVQNANIIIALYDENSTLKGIKYKEYQIQAGETAECGVEYTLSNLEEGDFIKAFLWDDIDSTKPLANAAEIR